MGNSMWVFGSDGVSVFNTDGSENLKAIEPEDICHMTAGYRGGDPSLSCSFYEVVSDGKKYVWAAVSRGVPKIDVLDIDTGDVVGSFETCPSVRDLEYHPLRDEIWVRCSQTDRDTTYPSYMDVISATSPTVAVQSDIKFKADTTINSWGYMVVDNTLGDVAYSTDWDQPYLFKIDLSEKSIIANFTMPLGHGTYEVAYSPKNRHIYARTSVCCTCGFEGATNEDCGRYGGSEVTMTTGPFAGQTKQGRCGRCDGIKDIDILGVYEFDTTTDTIVGNHVMKGNYGGDPYPSPNGDYIVLLARDGGTNIRILKTGASSEKSTVYADLALGFNSTNNEDDQVFNDFAFVEYEGKDIVVFASGTENKAAVVELNNGGDSVKVTKIDLGDGGAYTRDSRNVEWAVGTPYVWIDGHANEELYVIDILQNKLVKTITGITTSKMLSVQNYGRMKDLQMQQKAIEDAVASATANMGSSTSGVTSLETIEVPEYSDDNDIDTVGIIGLILGACALIVGSMNVFVMSRMRTDIASNKDDLMSLGSKEVA
jgi:hypothetical protein